MTDLKRDIEMERLRTENQGLREMLGIAGIPLNETDRTEEEAALQQQQEMLWRLADQAAQAANNNAASSWGSAFS